MDQTDKFGKKYYYEKSCDETDKPEKKYYCEMKSCHSLYSSQSNHEKHSDCLRKLPSTLRKLFKFEKKLGQGGFGYVFKILDREDDKTKALKIIKIFDKNEEIDEIELLQLKDLHHQNIVKYYRTNKLGSQSCFILMELCESDLQTAIDNDELTTFEKKMEIFLQICSGIQFLHDEVCI